MVIKGMKTKYLLLICSSVLFVIFLSIPTYTIDVKANVSTNVSIANIISNEEIPMKEWTPIQVVSTQSTEDAYWPSISVDKEGNIDIFWRDNTDYLGSGTDGDIFQKSHDVHSQDWSLTEVISNESSGLSNFPKHLVDEIGDIHLMWIDYTDYLGSGTDPDVFYRKWDASSTTWGTTEVVSTESTDSSYDLSFDIDKEGNIHVCWYDHTDYGGSGTDTDIFYKCWNATTQTWTTTQVISIESTEYSLGPSLVIDNLGNVHIAWADETDYLGSGTDRDIFYKRWDRATNTWSVIEVISTESTGASSHPKIQVSSKGFIHIIWEDITDLSSGTDMDIFYKYWNEISEVWTSTVVLSNSCPGSSGVSRSSRRHRGFIICM